MPFYRRYIRYVHLQEVQDITHAHMHEQTDGQGVNLDAFALFFELDCYTIRSLFQGHFYRNVTVQNEP